MFLVPVRGQRIDSFSPRRPVQIDREGVSKNMGGTDNLKKASANDVPEENCPLVARVHLRRRRRRRRGQCHDDDDDKRVSTGLTV